MMRMRAWTHAMVIAALAAICVTAEAQAQGWNYPSFQIPEITVREFNFAVADGGDAGNSLVAQWREGISSATQLTFDAGFADPDGRDNSHFVLGGGVAHQLTRATQDMPLALVFTAGLYGAFGDPTNIFRLPVGVSVGHRFGTQSGVAITPYVHPRLSLDFCSSDRFCGGDDSDLSVNFDLGSDFQLTRELAIRASVLFGSSDLFGNDDTGFGISVAWKPGARAPR
ncbi:MAG TPA: hypothetical protein VFK13_11505 [Gemmatimonadaceae bacterium]|nr:hypothetical protein [Gemmatimonadaceae bacterium]